MPEVTRSEKHEQARSVLPPALVPIFDDLVADYQFLGTLHYDRPFVSYLILADLVKRGWRRLEGHDKEPVRPE